MTKLTVDQMIGRLTPDRQEAVLAKAQRMTQSRERARFESLDDVLERLPADQRADIEKDADR